MTDKDKNQTIAQRNQAMNPTMTLACPAYLHRLVPVQDWKLVDDVKAPEKTTYTSLINHKEQ
jgi:hypothetical protein